jgi:2-polyprenyl-3-methyl-5-hydroxy-6-metoxy-1,4-benzoquinol methylase
MTADLSRDAAYFDRIYARDGDPWRFATSDYERAKYAATIAALNGRRFMSALEIGCSIGVLTSQLAAHCEALLAIDIAAAALDAAQTRCGDLPHVGFQRMAVPREWPVGQFDLVVISEVLYFLAPAAIAALADRVTSSLAPGGSVLLVNWLGVADNPCSGDTAARIFIDKARSRLSMTHAERQAEYRLDMLSA